MRIDQFVAGFAKHDAISNHALQIRTALRSRGYQSAIYGDVIDPRIGREAEEYERCASAADPDRLILYHASTHSGMASWLERAAAGGQVVAMDYHNMTPSRYFARWEPPAARSMEVGRHELARLRRATSFAMADSAYNEAELIDLGYHPTSVCPLLVDLADYHSEPDQKALAAAKRRKGRGNRWLFVGRFAPNKCQHDLVAAFAVYRKLFDPAAVLTLVGPATSPRYMRAVEQMAEDFDLGESVEIHESLPFRQLLAYFHASDVFVCVSEHEGFCVPILESMELGLPVVAFAAAAVGDTVGKAGVLLPDKDPLAVACAVDDLLSDETRRSALVAAGHTRASDFSLESTSKHLIETLEGWLNSSTSFGHKVMSK